MDPRHAYRIKIVQNLYSYSYNESKKNIPHPQDEKTIQIIKSLTQIDKLIAKYAPKYPLDKIAKTDLAILRLSTYELLLEKKEPEKVIINEAVELAKEFSGEKSFAFVNAVLGQILKAVKENN